jgi:drug/metabolite transporter superfamily protein YnfA
MQRYTVFFITVNALHVSGGFSAHHQELKNSKHVIWYVPGLLLLPLAVAAASLARTRCCVYSFELLMVGGETA